MLMAIGRNSLPDAHGPMRIGAAPADSLADPSQRILVLERARHYLDACLPRHTCSDACRSGSAFVGSSSQGQFEDLTALTPTQTKVALKKAMPQEGPMLGICTRQLHETGERSTRNFLAGPAEESRCQRRERAGRCVMFVSSFSHRTRLGTA